MVEKNAGQTILPGLIAAGHDRRPRRMSSSPANSSWALVRFRRKGEAASPRGGRNMEFLLAFAIAMAGEPGIFALAADSDGIDGTEDGAGAIVTPDTLARAP